MVISFPVHKNVERNITMSRRVFVEVKVKLVLDMDEGIEVGGVLGEMDYNFTSHTEGAEILDTEIEDWDIRDSK